MCRFLASCASVFWEFGSLFLSVAWMTVSVSSRLIKLSRAQCEQLVGDWLFLFWRTSCLYPCSFMMSRCLNSSCRNPSVWLSGAETVRVWVTWLWRRLLWCQLFLSGSFSVWNFHIRSGWDKEGLLWTVNHGELLCESLKWTWVSFCYVEKLLLSVTFVSVSLMIIFKPPKQQLGSQQARATPAYFTQSSSASVPILNWRMWNVFLQLILWFIWTMMFAGF